MHKFNIMPFQFKNITFGDAVAYLQVLSLWVLVACIPFYFNAAIRGIMFAAGGLFVLDYVVNRRWKSWRWTRNKVFYIACLAYFCFALLWQIGSTPTPHFSAVLGERAALALVGIIGFAGLSEKVTLRPIGYVMLSVCVGTSLWLLLYSTGFAFFASPFDEQSNAFTLARIEYINSHMMYNLYLNISLVFAFYILSCKDCKKWVKVLVGIGMAWVFYILCLTEGRVGLFTALVLGALFTMIATLRRSKKWFIPLTIAYGIVCIGIAFQHNRLKTEYVENDARWSLWEQAAQMIEQKPILGYGVSQAREVLIDKVMHTEDLTAYTQSVVTVHHQTLQSIQPHNAFLEAWIEFGLLGVAMLLFLFVFPLTMRPRCHRVYLFCICFAFVVQSMFDSFFCPLLYCLSVLLFTSQNETERGSVAQKPSVTPPASGSL